jgi:hypothetical protein
MADPLRMEVRDSLDAIVLVFEEGEIGFENPGSDYQNLATRMLKRFREAGLWRARSVHFMAGGRLLGSYHEDEDIEGHGD